MRFAVESYLETHARKFVGQFDPCSYLYLSRAMDNFDFCDSSETLKRMFDRCFSGEALVLGVKTDILFPLTQQKDLAAALEASGNDVAYQALPSVQGHDAFLADVPTFGKPIRKWLQ
jgi:homoserine acetyltransferase